MKLISVNLTCSNLAQAFGLADCSFLKKILDLWTFSKSDHKLNSRWAYLGVPSNFWKAWQFGSVQCETMKHGRLMTVNFVWKWHQSATPKFLTVTIVWSQILMVRPRYLQLTKYCAQGYWPQFCVFKYKLTCPMYNIWVIQVMAYKIK